MISTTAEKEISDVYFPDFEDAVPLKIACSKSNPLWTVPEINQPPFLQTVRNEGWLTLEQFSRALKNAEICDNLGVALPGAIVTLPFGVRLMNRYAQIVRQTYASFGLEEFDYPLLCPSENFEAVLQPLGLYNCILHVGTDHDFAQSMPRGTLCPSGEEVIYPDWKRRVSSEFALPIQMFRQARFFRPVPRSGCSVFRPMEAIDVYEFHCAYSNTGEKDEAIIRYVHMLRELCRRVHVPTIWLTRPPWTNNSAVAHYCIAGDTPLPTGSSLQSACLYNQGQLFSKRYEIGYRRNGVFMYTQQLAGAVSRRLLYAHLMLGMNGAGTLSVHPDLAPDQVSILLMPSAYDSDEDLRVVEKMVEYSNIRTHVEIAKSNQRASGWLRQNQARGTPLLLLVQGRRAVSDQYKLIFRRSDTNQELVLYTNGLEQVSPTCEAALSEIQAQFQRATNDFYVAQRMQVTSKEELSEYLGQRFVCIAPLSFSEQAVLTVASWKKGEVLGYCRSPELRKCVVTGRDTPFLAFVSQRI